MKKIMNVCAYCRVSHEEQKKFGFSIDAQIDKVKKYCELRNYNLVGLYVDEGFTASNMERPELIKMLNNLDKVDALLFTRLDRLSRNVLEANKMLQTLNKHNVSMIAIEEEDINTSDADGLFMFQMKVSLAEREIKKTSERIKSVFDYKVKEGQPITGSQPFGYKVGKVDGKKCIVFDENKEILDEIFLYFSKYQSVRKTMFYINEKYNLEKHYSSYCNILKNSFYTGSYRGNNNYCPAYIDKKTFEHNQKLIKANIRVNKTRNVYLFANLLICPVCGRKLAGTTAKNNRLKYRCNSYIEKRCTFKTHFAELKMEKKLINTLEHELEKHILNARNVNIVDIKCYTKEIQSIKKELENLNYLFRKNRISLKDYDREYDELEAELKKLQSMEIEQVNLTKFEKVLNSDWKGIYKNLNQENKQLFWRYLIKEINIVDSKYVFSINFTA